MVEQAFVTSPIKSDGSILPFFERPISAVLAASTIAAFASPPGTVIADAAEELIHKLNARLGHSEAAE